MTPNDSPAAPAGLAELHRSEDGMISIVSVIVLLFILVLIGLVGNAGYTINRKMEVQNSADAAAYSSTVWIARGMNTITATNHLIGELQALVVLHQAIGGEELENKDPLDPTEAQKAKADLDQASQELDIAWEVIYLMTSTPAYPGPNQKVGEKVKSGATVRAAMTDLKKALTKVYIAKAAAMILEKTPAAEIGVVIDAVASGVEYVILAEYTVVKAMEDFASNGSVLAVRNILFDQLLPNASDYERLVSESVPHIARETALAIAERNGTTGAIFPREPALPVLRDKTQPKQNGDLPRSTLVRATFPWVKYDRTPLLRLMTWMIFSHTRDHYVKYTNHYTLFKSKELYNGSRDFAMYVMTRPGETKGQEPWTNNSREADRKFTIVGFARRPSRTLFSPAVFGRPNRDGMVGCAQAIFYNNNSQNPGSGPPTFQPEVGWDTLNWEPPVASSAAFEFKEGPDELDDCPRIRVNWQVKLVPVSRLGEAARSGDLDGPFQTVLDRLGPNANRLITH